MINIVIAAQQPIFRTGLAKLIAIEDDLRIIGQPLSLAHLHNVVSQLRPQLALLSSDFCAAIADFAPVIRLTAAAGGSTVVLAERPEQALEFASLGAQGILSRKIHGDTLITSIRRVAGGELLLHAPPDLQTPPRTDPVGERVASTLSGRELRIIKAILRGRKNAEIAKQLGISMPLLKKQLGLIYDKTGVWGRLELALYMMHHPGLALAAPEKRPAAMSARSAAATADGMVGQMLHSAIKPERRSGFGSRARGTSLGTTGAPPEYGK